MLATVLLQDVRRAVLPVLAKLLSDASVREHVPNVLAELLKENTELQATAADADAVPKLALLLQQENSSLRLKVQSACDALSQRNSSHCWVVCDLLYVRYDITLQGQRSPSLLTPAVCFRKVPCAR